MGITLSQTQTLRRIAAFPRRARLTSRSSVPHTGVRHGTRPQRSAAMVWCKDCSALGTKKRAAWGMPQDGKKQWCAACRRD
eukprot:COSAG06_NODE_30790_length_532_cov_1.055427_1_plen_80_part_10